MRSIFPTPIPGPSNTRRSNPRARGACSPCPPSERCGPISSGRAGRRRLARVSQEGREMAYLVENPTLGDLQHYLAAVCQERGWTKDSPSEKFVLFIEEVGELAKAMRKAAGLYEERAKP